MQKVNNVETLQKFYTATTNTEGHHCGNNSRRPTLQGETIAEGYHCGNNSRRPTLQGETFAEGHHCGNNSRRPTLQGKTFAEGQHCDNSDGQRCGNNWKSSTLWELPQTANTADGNNCGTDLGGNSAECQQFGHHSRSTL